MQHLLFRFCPLTVLQSLPQEGATENILDSLDWSRTFAIFSISRLSLHSAGIPVELVRSLTDTDMEAIAEQIAEYVLREPIEQIAEFVARLYLAEKGQVERTTETEH